MSRPLDHTRRRLLGALGAAAVTCPFALAARAQDAATPRPRVTEAPQEPQPGVSGEPNNRRSWLEMRLVSPATALPPRRLRPAHASELRQNEPKR